MAIQLRRGNSADLIKSNLLSGEMAVSVDTGVPTVGLGNGKSVDIVTNETFATQINQFGGISFSEQEESIKGYFDENGNEIESSDGYMFSDFEPVDYATNYYICISQTYYDDDDNEMNFFPSGYKAAAYDSNGNALGIVNLIEVVKNRLYVFNSEYSTAKIKICCLSPTDAVYNAFEKADYVFEQALLNIFNHITDGYGGDEKSELDSSTPLTSASYDIAALKSRGALSVNSSGSTVSYTFDIGSVTSSPLEFTPSIKCPALTPKESGGFVQDSQILLDRLRLDIPADDFKGTVKEFAEQMGLTGDTLPCSVSFSYSTGHVFMTVSLDLSGVRDADSAKELLTEEIEHIELSWITPEVIT